MTITAPVDKTSPSEAKIALFRSLFRGREDVYPRCFESRKFGAFRMSAREAAGELRPALLRKA